MKMVTSGHCHSKMVQESAGGGQKLTNNHRFKGCEKKDINIKKLECQFNGALRE